MVELAYNLAKNQENFFKGCASRLFYWTALLTKIILVKTSYFKEVATCSETEAVCSKNTHLINFDLVRINRCYYYYKTDYIHVCKRKDPNINNCIINSVEQLRPKLIKGIPELDVPALEPLHLPEVVISRGGAFRAVGSNILVHGAGSFEITSLKANVEDLTYQIGVRFPKMTFDAIYDVNVRLLTVPLKGKGPINANATNIEGNGILKGHKEVKSNGKTYVIFDSLVLKLKMKNYSVRLENLFNGDKALGEAVNRALNENKREMMSMLRPQAERTVSAVLLDIANKITNHFEYDELFPL